MFITPSFKKSLIVEQFQGNYLKRFFNSEWGANFLYNFFELHYIFYGWLSLDFNI